MSANRFSLGSLAAVAVLSLLVGVFVASGMQGSQQTGNLNAVRLTSDANVQTYSTVDSDVPKILVGKMPKASILVHAKSNLLSESGGQEDLEGAVAYAFNSSDQCVKDNQNDPALIIESCQAVSSCTTDAVGECVLVVSPDANYYVAVSDSHEEHVGLEPGHSIGVVKANKVKTAEMVFGGNK